MKLLYTTRDGRMQFELEGKTQTDLFEQLSQVQEVFENGVCRRKGKESDNVRYRVREDKEENKYYELVCIDTDPVLRNAKLSFGQHKKGGTLYPHRKDKENKWLPDNGWVVYVPTKEEKVEENEQT